MVWICLTLEEAAKLFLEVAPFAFLPVVREVSALESRPPLGNLKLEPLESVGVERCASSLHLHSPRG